MNSKVTTAVVVGCFLALVFGVAWFEHRSAGRAGAALSALANKRAALESAVRRLEALGATAIRDRGKLPAMEMPRTPTTALPAAVTGNRSTSYGELMAVDPQFRALLLRAFRANLAGRFGSFYRALNLAPDQIAKFENLLVDNYAEIMDAMASAKSQELENDGPAITAVMQQQADQLRSAQVALLGESGYEQLEELNRAAPMATIVNRVAFSVASSSSPLTGSQIDALTRILARASSGFQSGGPADPATINWEAAMDQAQSVLSDPQLAALNVQREHAETKQMVAQFNQEEAAAK